MAHPDATSTDEEAREFCRAVLVTFPWHRHFCEAAR